MTAFNDIVAKALRTVRQVRGAAVTYRRGATSNPDVTAVQAAPLFAAADDGTPVVLSYEAADWLVMAADLTLDGVAVLPQRGDRIELADGRVYEATPVAGQAVYRFADAAGRSQLRIHTKLVTQPS